jgi:hypothetical protein
LRLSSDFLVSKFCFQIQLVPLHIELCASQMKLGAGVWQAAVYNPVRMSPMKYWVSFQKKGVCPSATEAECSGHGACHQDAADPDFATCKCNEGWTAADCNFRTCAEGSFIAVPGADSPHQTCYRQCREGRAGTLHHIILQLSTQFN